MKIVVRETTEDFLGHGWVGQVIREDSPEVKVRVWVLPDEPFSSYSKEELQAYLNAQAASLTDSTRGSYFGRRYHFELLGILER